MIRAVFFDFGGVLGRLDHAEIASVERRYGLPDGGFLRSLYGIPEWDEVQVGRRPEAEWITAVERKLDELAGRPIAGIRDVFHVVINSARVGVAKPDARIYHAASEAVGLDPSACVHIDDLEQNVRGAREAGFHAVHYRGDFSALERDLRSLGVEWS